MSCRCRGWKKCAEHWPGRGHHNAKALEAAEKDLTAITGQHPIIMRSKKSIANFRLRAGMPIGMKSLCAGRACGTSWRS